MKNNILKVLQFIFLFIPFISIILSILFFLNIKVYINQTEIIFILTVNLLLFSFYSIIFSIILFCIRFF